MSIILWQQHANKVVFMMDSLMNILLNLHVVSQNVPNFFLYSAGLPISGGNRRCFYRPCSISDQHLAAGSIKFAVNHPIASLVTLILYVQANVICVHLLLGLPLVACLNNAWDSLTAVICWSVSRLPLSIAFSRTRNRYASFLQYDY